MKPERMYLVTITETLERTVATKAKSMDEAVEKIERAWLHSDIVLTADDFNSHTVEPSVCDDIVTEEDMKYYPLFKGEDEEG